VYQEKLDAKQWPLAQEISYGVLRWYYRLDPLLAGFISKPLKGKKKIIHYLLLAGVYQLLYLDKADYAIVKETVDVCDELKQSWAKGLVNAILRRLLRQLQSEKIQLLTPFNQSYEQRYAYPQWLVTTIKQSWNKEASVEAILSAGNERPPMTLRLHPDVLPENYQQMLAEAHIEINTEAMRQFNPQMLVLNKPQSVDSLPLFSEGKVSVQDGAAQLAALILSPQKQERVLDACAAPGGKTMHLLEHQPALKNLTALDVSEERLQKVRQNARRLNASMQQLEVLSGDAALSDWWNGQPYDRILLDAPCSATGVIRRHPDIKLLRRPEDIVQLSNLQAQILENLWTMLKPGGQLLYATCSILREENDQQIGAFLEHHQEDAVEEPITAQWGRAMKFGRQILPGESGFDGFYYALLKKRS
jgi:16S rRNA (cytosine967-C5)-methyltransferase